MAPIFRTTQNSVTTNVVNNLQASLTRAGNIQAKLSSGKEVSKPSDNPVATAAALRYRSDGLETEQHPRNASDGIGWLGQADTALQQTLDAVRRVKELALSGSTATSDADARGALAGQAGQPKGQGGSPANTHYLNPPLFSGTAALSGGGGQDR